ncbi:MAG TPA: DUF4214 domain-containing protein, partial [Pirellulales bacterium]|nr:DUF4214 domain-containing protein [Pirellulales bacterium]
DVVANIVASQEFYDDAGDSNAGFVTRLYEKFLNREPDAAGLDFWLRLMAPPTNASRAQAAIQFYNTPEEHGVLVDSLFSEYFNGIHPLPDKTPYVTDLNNGDTETAVELKIIDSQQYRDNPPAPAAGTVGKALYDH